MIELCRAETPAELETWAEVKSAVVPNEPVTAAQLAATASDDRLLLLARLDGTVAGCGICGLSDFGALADHGRDLGRDGVNAFVYADDPGSIAFAERFSLAEVDYTARAGPRRRRRAAAGRLRGRRARRLRGAVVRRDRRGRGIARALEQAQLHRAAQSGVVELVTWTQKGNEAMQALNRRLGYVDRAKVTTYQGPLP